MKGLIGKPALCCMVLLPVPAMAEIQALNESQMGAVTGQAGVTIEYNTKLDLGGGSGTNTPSAASDANDDVRGLLNTPEAALAGGGITIDLETRVKIARFAYFDEGALTIDNIEIGGTNRYALFSELGSLTNGAPSALLDDVRMTADVLQDGDALINIRPETGLAIDVGVSTGEWTLQGNNDSTVVLNYFYMDSLISGATIAVDTASDSLYVGTGLAIGDLSFDSDFISLGVRNFKLTGANYDPDDPNPADLFAELGLIVYNGVRASGESALAVELSQFDADITIGSVLIGGTSIGSIAMDNLSISNTSMRIYGH